MTVSRLLPALLLAALPGPALADDGNESTFRACMQDHDAPTDVFSAEHRAAAEACGVELPDLPELPEGLTLPGCD